MSVKKFNKYALSTEVSEISIRISLLVSYSEHCLFGKGRLNRKVVSAFIKDVDDCLDKLKELL